MYIVFVRINRQQWLGRVIKDKGLYTLYRHRSINLFVTIDALIWLKRSDLFNWKPHLNMKIFC